jgi:acetoin utilization protein AcuB
MSLSKIMSTDIVKIDIDDTLSEVRNIFSLVTFHHILVVDNEKLVGVISDRDYLKSTTPKLGTPIETEKDISALNIKVHRIMNRKLITIKDSDTIFDAVCAFHKFKVTCVPVVDEYFKPVGIISWKDIINLLALNMIKKRKNAKEN